MSILFTLILWSSLCTAADIDCETGDYLTQGQYRTLAACESVLAAWKSVKPTNRGACYRKTGR